MIHIRGHATTPDVFKLITSAAGSIDYLLNYVKAVKATGVVSDIDRVSGNLGGAGNTALLTGPAAATDIYTLKHGIFTNISASVVNDLTPVHNDGTTDRKLPKYTLQPGEALQYNENIGLFQIVAASLGFGDVLERSIDADQTGTNVTTAQNWFPTNGAVAVEAGVTYDFAGLLGIVRAAGVTSHTVGVLFGGTATLTHIQWTGHVNNTDTLAAGAPNMASARTGATNVALHTTASTSATEDKMIYVVGCVKINAAGTFIPQFQYITAAPGGAPTIKTGSFFRLTKKGASFNTKGTWT